MLHYRTEIVVPPDRYVCLRLPDDLPVGRAFVTVEVEGPLALGVGEGTAEPADGDPDREDIEWWEEFEAEPGESTRGDAGR